MSGGHFGYDQYTIGRIADSIEEAIQKSGRKLTENEIKDEFGFDKDWLIKHPEDAYHYKYPNKVIKVFEDAIRALRIAAIYAQRVDYLLCDDDSEESFLEQLKEDLAKEIP